MDEDTARLIRWLENASVTKFHFTIEGEQEVCKPKYLLTRHRDKIIAALKAAHSADKQTSE